MCNNIDIIINYSIFIIIIINNILDFNYATITCFNFN